MIRSSPRQRRARLLAPPEYLLLERQVAPVPMLHRDTDATRHEVAAALHPGLVGAIGPHDLVRRAGHELLATGDGMHLVRPLGDGILSAVLEAHQVARR